MSALIRFQAHGRTRGPLEQQRGAASLVVVLMLFFVIALVSAYTSRNLIFEQRTSVNQYRSSMAFETADAGIEWALALLNSGRIGNDCSEATAAADSSSFRQRYLSIDPVTGTITPRKQFTNPAKELKPTCVWTGTGWACNCPTDGDSNLAEPAAPGLHPAFRVLFVPQTAREGVFRIQVNGCVRMSEECLNDFSDRPRDSEGRAQHTTLVALKSGVTTPPAAALTVFGNVLGGGAAVIQNSDAKAGGITIQAAGAVNTAGLTLRSAPGTPGERSVMASDNTLVPNGLTVANLLALPALPLNWDRVFGSVFGLLPATYREQPAARVLNCPNTGCRAALSSLVAANPDRVIWIPGDLTLESAGDVGSLPNPATPAVAGAATIIVEGRVRFLTPGVNIFGVVHARKGNWEGSGTITGAALVEGDLAATASPTVLYDQAVINATRLSSGSFVPVQGDWKDFK